MTTDETLRPPDEPVNVSVVVPAYREAATIEEALRRLTAALDDFGRSYEVIVVSDGNTDGTAEQARGLDHPRIEVLHYTPNRGKGFAVRHGSTAAQGDLVVFIDADLDIHPDGIATLITILDESGADVVVASKVHAESTVYYPRIRRAQSLVFRLLVRTLFSLAVTDTQTGLKVFRRHVLDDCLPHLTSEGFAFDLELLVLANDHGHQIVEGPLELDYQFSSTTGVAAVADVLKDIRALHSRRRAGLRDGSWLA